MQWNVFIEVKQSELKQVLQLRVISERLQVLQRQLVEEGLPQHSFAVQDRQANQLGMKGAKREKTTGTP